ncbi:MAG TPA: MFS transporter [Trueperaceae bacterium]|nr:MFS transporter [Trueperaceae bacterium]
MRALRPFETGQYRLLAAALVASLFGSGIWAVAMVWQVIELGGGPVQLSAVAAAAAIGLLAAVLVGGAVADRVPQRRILMTVELCKAVLVGTAAVLALTGTLDVPHLVVVALLLGIADGFFYPAYSAMLPSILPEDQLLAANGIEGVLRPGIQQAAGPALAGVLIALLSPGHALAVVAAMQLLAGLSLMNLRARAVRREVDAEQNPIVGALLDIREGFAYMVKTPWILATLLMACAMLLVIMGPIQVLMPFAIREQMGGGAGAFAAALTAFGIGSGVGSMTVASLRLPRRYLSAMLLLWGVSCVPLVVVGVSTRLWPVLVALFVVGTLSAAANVIWGTLLQRRVPPALLGRVSSLDFFVSLALMPLSMAVAGPVGEAIGFRATFAIAAFVPPVLAVVAIVAARLRRDEVENPLDAARQPAIS